jgi:homoserine dehydrogenase
LCFLGFGNVNRALVRLLDARRKELREKYEVDYRITGVASRRLGWIANTKGLGVAEALALNPTAPGGTKVPAGSDTKATNVREWMAAAEAEVLFEATSLNALTGQPAIDYLRAALERSAHAITANKGPVVHAYEQLTELADRMERRFLFESTVMDGIPIFSLFRETLPALPLKGFRGILNSTTNVILTEMEKGLSFDAALKKAQEAGVAETDAANDIDGWDASVKVAALVRVLMGVKLPVGEVKRQGIRGLSGERVMAARAEGRPYKLVCRATRVANGVQASVKPEQVPQTDPLALISGTSSAVYFETEVFAGLGVVEESPGPDATAYGMFADFVRAVGARGGVGPLA